MLSKLVPGGGGLRKVFKGPGSIFPLIDKSDFRKMCPFSSVTVCSEESMIASLTGLK